MFYTNVLLQGNNILERFIDENGNSCQRTVSFSPSLFKHTPTGEYTDIYGKSASEVFFDTVSDARAWKKSMSNINREALGMDDFALQYIHKNYKNVKYDFDKINIAFLDIEVPTDGPFPKPDVAEYEMDAITLYCTKTAKYHVFSTRPWAKTKSVLTESQLDAVDFHKCESEKELIAKFLKFWTADIPDILTGWNTEGFDVPYLVNRIRRVLGNRFVEKLSPWGKVTERTTYDANGEEQIVYDINGVSLIDYLAAYKKFTFKTRPSYKLDYIGEVELKVNKIAMQYRTYIEFSQNDPQKYIDYNIRDVEIVVKLEARLNLLRMITALSYYAGVNYSNTFSPLKTWDAIIHNVLSDDNIVIPESKNREKIPFAGAYVKDPITALYKWLVSFDLTSLYPHLIMQYNISPETIISQFDMPRVFVKDRYIPDIDGIGLVSGAFKVPHENHSFAANGMRYSKTKLGIVPRVTQSLFVQRKDAKRQEFAADALATQASLLLNQRKADNVDIQQELSSFEFFFDNIVKNVETPESELKKLTNTQLANIIIKARAEEKLQNVLQMVRKVLLNSLYGALGNAHFRYFDTRNAEAITISGRLSIRWIERKVNEFLNNLLGTINHDYICYIDTDSIYVCVEKLVEFMASKRGIKISDIETSRWVDALDKFASTKCEPFINESYKELALYMNAYEQKMFMDREVIADSGFWTAKKRYALNVWDSEGKRKYDENGKLVPKLKIMGLETQRSTTPPYASESLEKSIKLILTTDEKTLQQFVSTVKSDYKHQPYEKVAAVSSANNIEGNSTSDFTPLKGCPGHVKAALAYNRLTLVHTNVPQIRSGEKIQMMLLKQPNIMQTDIIGFPSGTEFPVDFGIDLKKCIDFKAMYEKHYIKPLSTICDAIGWDYEKKASLATLFDM
ncbi:MAG: DNA polymerase domain-containing protein [Culicoidibacterales bacterium]